MIRSLILRCILALLPQNAFAEYYKELGLYTCTVKTTQLVIMEDGIVQEYSGYENSTGVGDKLIFEILVPTETQESRQITLHLKDAKDRTLTWGYIFKPEVKSVFGLKIVRQYHNMMGQELSPKTDGRRVV